MKKKKYNNHKAFFRSRQKIEKINKQLETLLEKRFVLTNNIGQYKLQNNLPITDFERENCLEKKITHNIYYNYTKEILIKVFEESKLQQKRLKYPSIILIGMPGSGKTAFGKHISNELDIPFVDVDETIVARKGMWETEIFKKKGEQYYRKLEKKVVKDLPRGFIISVGGGTVLDNDNLAHLKKIGKLIYIKRNLNDLKKFNFYRRPLINSKEDLEKMYKERKKIYEKVSDYTILNNLSFMQVKEEIKTLVIKLWR